jgi:hypothetical protein
MLPQERLALPSSPAPPPPPPPSSSTNAFPAPPSGMSPGSTAATSRYKRSVGGRVLACASVESVRSTLVVATESLALRMNEAVAEETAMV